MLSFHPLYVRSISTFEATLGRQCVSCVCQTLKGRGGYGSISVMLSNKVVQATPYYFS